MIDKMTLSDQYLNSDSPFSNSNVRHTLASKAERIYSLILRFAYIASASRFIITLKSLFARSSISLFLISLGLFCTAFLPEVP